MARYFSLWFRHLETDWMAIRHPEYKDAAFVLSAPERGRKVIRAVSPAALSQGIVTGMVVADARAVYPSLQVFDHDPELAPKLLARIAKWCLRYTPFTAVDLPDGVTLEISGCPHLWGGEKPYLREITTKLRDGGFNVRGAIADTIAAARAIARYGTVTPIIDPGGQLEALLSLPPSCLRLEDAILQKLRKLGLSTIRSFISMPRPALRRRFGQGLLDRIDEATGIRKEPITPIQEIEPYQERLPCLEPIRTRPGIEIALDKLLTALCQRLLKEQKGLRKAVFKGFRIDGATQRIEIATGQPSRNIKHLTHLFGIKLEEIAPGLGIELFLLEAPVVEPLTQVQEALWAAAISESGMELPHLLDRITARLGPQAVQRYLPAQHYWPERAIKPALSLDEQPLSLWRVPRPRPVYLLPSPVRVQVTAPIPDYPPMLFIYQGNIYKVKKADGPERIESEWWLEDSEHRDYYVLEDEQGARYWLFRLGHYDEHQPEWFLHGFFA